MANSDRVRKPQNSIMADIERLKHLNGRLRLAREFAQYTQQELADILNVSKRQLIRYEQGDVEPTLSYVVHLAKATDKDLQWFLEVIGSDLTEDDLDM